MTVQLALQLAALIYLIVLLHFYGLVPLVKKIASWGKAEAPRVADTAEGLWDKMFAHAAATNSNLILKTGSGAEVFLTPKIAPPTAHQSVPTSVPQVALDPVTATVAWLKDKTQPTLYQLAWLAAKSPLDRCAWGQQCALAFPRPAAPADLPANETFNATPATLDDLTNLTTDAQGYLATIAQGAPPSVPPFRFLAAGN